MKNVSIKKNPVLKTATRIIATLLVLFCVAIPPVVFAAGEDPCSGVGASSDYCKSLKSGGSDDPFKSTVSKVTTTIAFIGGFLAILWIIFMGIKFATASGNPEKAATARNGIIYAAVGLVIIVAAQALILLAIKVM